MSGLRHNLLALGIMGLLTGCGEQLAAINTTLQSGGGDRSAWAEAPEPVRIAHARALHTALTGRTENDPLSWSAAGASGVITMLRSKELQDSGGNTVCRAFSDEITHSGGSSKITDVSCWGGQWNYMTEPEPTPILTPAFAEEDRVYTVRSGGTLRAVARRTGASQRDLIILNPGLPDRLPRGTKVLLP